MDACGSDSAVTETEITIMNRTLYEAAAEGDISAFPDERPSSLHLNILTPSKNTVLHIHITALRGKERTDFVEKILDLCPPLLLQENTKGDIPLHVAARNGHCDIVEVLIQRAKSVHSEDLERGIVATRDMIRMRNKEKDTALHEAVRYNRPDVLKLLFKEDHEWFSYSANVAGETPLYLAAERGCDDLVSIIIEKSILPAHGGPKGRTALHAAVIHNYKGITKTLLDWKKVLTREVDEQGWTPLHHAADKDYISMVKLLLEYDIYAAYVADKANKRTALHIAAKRNHTEIVKELILRCPDCCELVDKEGQNVLHYAFVTKSLPTLRFILRNSSLSYLINEKDKKGNTPLQLTCSLLYYYQHPLVINQIDTMALKDGKSSAFMRKFSVAKDILLEGFREGFSECFRQRFEKTGFKVGGYKFVFKDDDGNTPSEVNDQWSLDQLKEESKNQLIVATLITTVTFAAAFALPGGYIQDSGKYQGTPILVRKSAFQVFVVSNSLGLVCSTSSVILHLTLSVIADKKRFFENFKLMTILNLYALIAMMVAFVAGSWAVLGDSPKLTTIICSVACVFGPAAINSILPELLQIISPIPYKRDYKKA